MSRLHVGVLLPAMLAAASLFAQEAPKPPAAPYRPTSTSSAPSANRVAPATPATPASALPPGGNRVFGVFPNYRTADWSQRGTVLSNRQKLSIAARDSFDYPTVLLAAAVAGIGQWSEFESVLRTGSERIRAPVDYQLCGPGDRKHAYRGRVSGAAERGSPIFQARNREHVEAPGLRSDARGDHPKGWRRIAFQWVGVARSATTVGIANAYYPDSRTSGAMRRGSLR